MKNPVPPLWFIVLLSLQLAACKKDTFSKIEEPAASDHPVLLLQKGEEQQIRDLIQQEPVWSGIHLAILERANTIFRKDPLQRQLIGRRLLSVSRECIHRVFYLSYAYRMTGDQRFLQRAEEEMVNVAGFSDWNPSHFLDVAEMTMGLAIGYDWLYDQLSEDARSKIENAIRTKGLEPSFNSDYNWFVGSTNNWNQVCNAGMTFGALAVQDVYPDLAKAIIDRALESIKLPMGVYGPDGTYPEGYGYWGYGTTTNVLFLHAIEESLGSDYGLSAVQGFLQTAEFLEHMLAPSGKCFNWGDCNPGGSLKPAMFWFAQKTSDPSILYMENQFLQQNNPSSFTGDRFLPALLIWAKDIDLGSIPEPASNVWIGQGQNPVALMRTSWSDPLGIYLGFKTGSPSVNHGHMDIGSFIMEADGERWASDFGLQNYESLESKGLSIFGRTQNAQRWTIFRYNNLAHNTLTINGEHQRVDGYTKIDRYSEDPAFSYAISDISSVYKTQLSEAKRGVGIIDQNYVIIQDELTTLDQPATIRWTMMTEAHVTLTPQGATLIKNGKTLYLQVKGPDNLVLKTWSTEPITDYDAPNPGTILLGFECELPANATGRFQVFLVPQKAEDRVQTFDRALADW